LGQKKTQIKGKFQRFIFIAFATTLTVLLFIALFSWIIVGAPLEIVLYRMLPLVVLFFVIASYFIIIYVIRSSPKSYRQKFKALWKVENKFEENAKETIIKNLGVDAWLDLSDNRYEMCLERMKGANFDAERFRQLKYYVNMKAAESCTYNSDYDKAIEFLKKAMNVIPNKFLPYYRSALNYEFKGDKDKAIFFYQKCIECLTEDDYELTNLMEVESERVKINGPKKAGDATGLKPIF
jgi:tetratricopeptide (TPR) repeat protein